MKRYPPVWRIDDWDDPWLPWYVRLVNHMPGTWIERWLPLTLEAELDRARRVTGLSEFGDDAFIEPLSLVLEDLNRSDHLTNMGRLTGHAVVAMQLQARLCLEHLIASHPEVERIPVTAPIFIAGLPRTGTTHLHNLLSQVSALRFIPYWQTLSPVGHPGHRSVQASVKARRRQHRVSLFCAEHVVPALKRMHEMELDMPHEELTLCALDYRSFFFEGIFQAPRYRAWYAAQDNTPGYRYLRRILQAITFEAATPGDPTRRWILKSPQHLDQLPAILRAFPDARIIRTHRDPARAVLSMITMVLYSTRQCYTPENRFAEARAWVDRLEGMLRRSVEQSDQLPEGSVMDVQFDAFMQAPEDTVRQVLAFAGVEYDAASARAVNTHLQSHTRDRHGRIDYRFEDLGLDEAEVRERFSFYRV
ncbi:sulfotransferase [uncultured Abyssibacter sp.]|uniref:sulfotransferase family protein n=1 Tax=uncultured Abyssibacter sp. TaxID=2320202 RepID=UPI0032B16F79